MLNWDELINQMRAVSDELQQEDGDVGELGQIIDGWADRIEEERAPGAIAKAVSMARAFHVNKQRNND